MNRIIIIRIGEIYLKGKNRSYFESLLMRNIKNKLSGFNCKLFFGRNRYAVSSFNPSDEQDIIKALKKVFGINSLSTGYSAQPTIEAIKELALKTAPDSGKFRVTVNRADKRFPMTSPQLGAEVGAYVFENKKGLVVDLHDPDFVINIDIREDGNAYVFSDKIPGPGGMPVGSAGKGLLLLSGGIDSPVAGFMMSKRGLAIDALHFHSYPYTSEMARDKVEKLASIMTEYCGKINLVTVKMTEIQEAIHQYCDASYMITLLRRFMMQIAEKVAKIRNLDCLVNGESLGQVASQTVQSITVTNAVIKDLPVLRPLIGMDKQEILDIAKKIDTYETSILPYEDCCTVFLPENPVTKPNLARCESEEAKIPDIEGLMDRAFASIEIKTINDRIES